MIEEQLEYAHHLMPSYQQLDTVADAYIPTLVLMALFLVARAMKRNWRWSAMHFAFVVCALLEVYGLMWIDQIFLLWPSVGLDYSTHSALALALVASLIVIERRLFIPLVISLLGYVALMLYQRYHTWADVLSTLLVVGGLLLMQMHLFGVIKNFKASQRLSALPARK